jgi:hypothetical protein
MLSADNMLSVSMLSSDNMLSDEITLSDDKMLSVDNKLSVICYQLITLSENTSQHKKFYHLVTWRYQIICYQITYFINFTHSTYFERILLPVTLQLNMSRKRLGTFKHKISSTDALILLLIFVVGLLNFLKDIGYM